MILDKLENLSRYKVLFPELFQFIENTDLHALPLGKLDVSEHLFALVNEYETSSKDIEILENHKIHVDFQIVLSGYEKVAFADSGISEFKAYDAEADYELVLAKPDFFELKTGFFAVLYPNEYHHAGLTIDQPQKVKKIVFKLKI